MTLKARGYPGSWFADIGTERLPCVHDFWRTKDETWYFDPYYGAGSKKWESFVEAIRRGKVILTTSKVRGADAESRQFKRTGYLGVFEVDRVTADERGLSFRFGRKIADLA